jgi:hypothetical protein
MALADQVLFVLAKEGISAESWVYAHNENGFDGLGDFFRSMSEAWRGWDDEHRWSSLEGDDGHVTVGGEASRIHRMVR